MRRFQTLVPTSEQKNYVDKIFSAVTFYHRKDDQHRKSSYYERYYGMLGQVIVADILNQPRPVRITDEFDIKINDVKTDVKVGSVYYYPKLDYHLTVFTRQLKPEKDYYYLFLFYNPEKNVFYIAGIMSGLGIKNTARIIKKGEKRPGNKDYIADCDQYDLLVMNTAACKLPL